MNQEEIKQQIKKYGRLTNIFYWTFIVFAVGGTILLFFDLKPFYLIAFAIGVLAIIPTYVYSKEYDKLIDELNPELNANEMNDGEMDKSD